MAEAPWLTIVGLGEDGPDGLPPASRRALDAAEVVTGPPRHLSLLPPLDAALVPWPVPFADGLPRLVGMRGRRVVALASGDPFWFGAGSVIARHLAPGEWRALPGPSTFALAAARLGWPLEDCACLGHHARPLGDLRPHLHDGARLIVLLRDGNAVTGLAQCLTGAGFGGSRLHVMTALGGPREAVTETRAATCPERDFGAPVCAAVTVAGEGPALPRASGIDDGFFETDGQITKRPIRALTLSALAPRPGEMLWDIGGGSGSIAIEWLLAHPSTRALAVEVRPDRAATIRGNAARLGVSRLGVIEGSAPAALEGLDPPAAIFVGGGLGPELLGFLEARATGVRLVVNAVTLESEALLADLHARRGGDLIRVSLSEAGPLGGKRGWQTGYPLVQWSGVL